MIKSDEKSSKPSALNSLNPKQMQRSRFVPELVDAPEMEHGAPAGGAPLFSYNLMNLPASPVSHAVQCKWPEDEELQMKPSSSCPECEEEKIQAKSMDDNIIPAVQRQPDPDAEEYEALQGKFLSVQRRAPEEDEEIQTKSFSNGVNPIVQKQAEPKPNRTGIPDHLKVAIESLSGIDMSDVRVHANSDKPARLNALAYAQGNEIHMCPGQERHLLHEAWHVVQQKQGRVRPTMQIRGVVVNDDIGLEREADRIGAKVACRGGVITQSQTSQDQKGGDKSPSPLVNGQVQWVPVMQHKIDLDMLKKAMPLDPIQEQIAEKISEYNDIESEKTKTDMEKAEQGNEIFVRLKKVDLQIYDWFDKISNTHDRLSDHPHYNIMNGLLNETQREHIDQIDRYKDNPAVTPFSTAGMGTKEKEDSEKTWRSLVKGTGMIRRIGSKGFSNEMLSHMAKMMDTGIGRELLTYLNTPLTKEDEKDDSKRIYLAENLEKLPKAVRKILNKADLPSSSYAKAITRSGLKPEGITPRDNKDFVIVEAPPSHPVLDSTKGSATDLTHLAMKHNQGVKGVTYAGKEYDFGEGTGSFVHLSKGDSSVLGGQDNKEILGPRFITLAHELGHAAHNKAGASYSPKEFMVGIGGFGTSQDAEDLWDDSEEFNTIKDVENPMREQYGIDTKRTSHKNPQDLKILRWSRTEPGILAREQAVLNIWEVENFNQKDGVVNDIIMKMAEKTGMKGELWEACRKWFAEVRDKMNPKYLDPNWCADMQRKKQEYKKMVGIKDIDFNVVVVEEPPSLTT